MANPQIHAIKPTFAGGEFAPSMYSRVDVARYTSGVKKLLNFIVHPHGGVSNRPGWHYVAHAKYSDRVFRLHDFQFSSTQTYALEFGHQYIRFYTNGGQIAVSSASAWVSTTAYVVGNFVSQGGVIYYCIVAHTAGTFNTDLSNGKWVAQTIYEVPSPYSESDLARLSFTQSADVLFIFHPLYQTRQLNRLGSTNWTVTLYDFLYGPFQLPNSTTTLTITPSAVTGSITLTASAAVFNVLQIGGLYQINHNVPEASVNSSLASVAADSSITCGGTWRLITHGTWSGTIAVQKSTDGGSTWTNIRSFSSASDFNANTFGTEDMTNNAPNFLVRLNMSAYTSGTCSYTLTADAFRNVGVVKITAFSSSTSVTATVTKTLGLTTATSDWAEGSWSDYRGWPAVGEFNQDRLVTGNTTTEPQNIWQTKTSNYYDYARNYPLTDADGITTRLPARQLNGVTNFIPLTQLLALTSSSEWGIGSPNTVMSPLTITQTPFSFNGSNGLKPIIIKNRAIYVQFMGGVVLDLGFDLLSNTFTGADLSILANHLFSGYNIVDMCYQQYPDSIVWCVRDDGVLLSLTYLREQEVVAWAHHETSGLVETLCSIPANGYNQVWLGVQRGDDRFIEYMDHRMASLLPEDQFFVDCGISYDGSLPDSYVKLYLAFDGVDSSQIFTDGELTPKTVTANGTAAISTEASKFGGASGKFLGDAGNDSFTKLLLHCDGTDASTTFVDSEITPKTVTTNGNAIISTAIKKIGISSGYFNTGIDSFTVLMLHCNGTNASQTFTDSETTPKTVTANGGAQISTGNYKFSTGSGYFNGVGIDSYTVLMLHFDGTNGSTTFTDSSASAHTATAHGSSALSTANKEFGTASLLQTTSVSGVSLADSSDWNFGSGDFTIDTWIRFTNASDTQFLFLQRDDSDNAQSCILNPTSGTINYFVNSSRTTLADYTATGLTLAINTWYHIALVRNGVNFYIFINGVASTLTINTAISTNTLPDLTSLFVIGGRQISGSYDDSFIGYMDEFRISKGIARWNATFNVPVVAYSSTGDSLTLADSADWTFGTGDFTIDCWVKYSVTTGNIQNFYTNGVDGSNFVQAYLDASGKLTFRSIKGGVYSAQYVTTAVAISDTSWHHVAFVRNGTNFYIFVDGISQTLTATTPISTNNLAAQATTVIIGSASGAQYLTGYLDEFRISKGIARWTANFLPPLTAYSAGDYLSLADSADWSYGTGDFTIDFWAYHSILSDANYIYYQFADANNFFLIQTDASGGIQFHAVFGGVSKAIYNSVAGAVTTGTWQHIALVRNGTNVYVFVNGVSISLTVVTAISTNDLGNVAASLLIAGDNSAHFYNGFLDEFRVSKGVARWTSTFTPPTSAYSAPGYLTLADSADWNFGTGNFTIDFWVNFIQTTGTQFFCEQGADANNRFYFSLDNSVLKFFDNVASTTKASYSVAWTPTASTWYHLALVRSGTSLLIFINGVSQTLTTATAISTNDLGDQGGVFTIARSIVATSSYLNGYLDEFKVAKGVARWTANFTPPTVPGFQLTSNVITGLDYLEGRLVSVLADGAVSPQQTVIGGQITLPVAATKAHIGLPYTSDLETLNIETGLPDGTMQGRKVRVSKVTSRVLNSKGGYIGPDENNLKKFSSVFADYLTSTALYTGDLKNSLGAGYADGGRMFIRQTDPLPLTILALMPIINVAGTNMESA